MKRTTINEFGETVVMMDATDRGLLTEEEIQMISRIDDFEDVFDEDCPPMPEAMIIQMEQDIAARRRQNTGTAGSTGTHPVAGRAYA